MKKYLSLTLLLIFVINACTKITETNIEPKQEPKPYMTLQIGDLRQYYATGDNMFCAMEVVDTTRREDNQPVYVVKNSFYTEIGTFSGNTYLFLRDGYLWATELDTIREPNTNNVNPFNELKIISAFPKEGEIFLANEGASDYAKEYRKIKILDTFSTPSKTYYDVEECEIISADTTLRIWLYYAPVYGYVGTLLTKTYGSSLAYVTYLKVNKYEFGCFIQFDEKNVIEGIPDKYKNYKFIY